MPIPGLNKTLRVRWPKTIDGINIAVNDQGIPIMEETELPFTAKPFIEKENSRLPIHLRKKMDTLSYHDAPAPETVVKGVGVNLLKEDSEEVKALKAKLAQYEAADKERLEGGNNSGADLLGEGNTDDETNGEVVVEKKKAGRPKNLQNV